MSSKRTKWIFIRFKYHEKILFFITVKVTAYRKFFISLQSDFYSFHFGHSILFVSLNYTNDTIWNLIF